MAEDTKKINKEYYWLYGNTHTKGHKLTEEHKQKISNSNKNAKNKGAYFTKEYVCICCGNNYISSNKDTKYCSRSCTAKSRKVRKGFSVPDHVKEKISKTLTGKYTKEKAYQWIKDRTKLKDDSKERGGQLHREWSASVKKRDNWKCKIDNLDCEGRLESHHILSWKDYPELRYDISNGICLCKKHHPKKRNDEINLVSTFQQIVNKLN